MRLLFFSNGVKKEKGGKRKRTNLFLGMGSFCPKLILLLIGFANWRNWINQGIIWNWFCCRSSALCALILFCVLLDCVTTPYKDLFDSIIFLWFLMILLGVTNFIEIDGDRNQDGCTRLYLIVEVPPTLNLPFYQNENIIMCFYIYYNLDQCIQNLKVPLIFVVWAIWHLIY